MTSSAQWEAARRKAAASLASRWSEVESARVAYQTLSTDYNSALFAAIVKEAGVEFGDVVEELQGWGDGEPTGRRGRVVKFGLYGWCDVLLCKRDGSDGKAKGNFSNWRKVTS